MDYQIHAGEVTTSRSITILVRYESLTRAFADLLDQLRHADGGIGPDLVLVDAVMVGQDGTQVDHMTPLQHRGGLS